ncbi:hypothetical protein [Chryseobacterium sp. G0186]|uniref:hypothetical protein n=1 Tax=Chryseobacterium sp. G0186 TaxID=2487064 RepID=UPI000F501749|nr:hypothetical protein [Chryseobacterium sp. G0186]
MKNTIIYKMISYVSLVLAGVFFFELIKEFRDFSLMEMSLIALVSLILISCNAFISISFLMKKIKPGVLLMIFQIVMIIFTNWVLFQIYTSEVVCTEKVLSH